LPRSSSRGRSTLRNARPVVILVTSHPHRISAEVGCRHDLVMNLRMLQTLLIRFFGHRAGSWSPRGSVVQPLSSAAVKLRMLSVILVGVFIPVEILSSDRNWTSRPPPALYYSKQSSPASAHHSVGQAPPTPGGFRFDRGQIRETVRPGEPHSSTIGAYAAKEVEWLALCMRLEELLR
jgi:hypothetical protein